ncbi:MAG: hypothetical protein FJW36_08265 [Acidobacteria bacterium]|nr:hypothetical protein [Acidobacteriota bacterium]
MPSEFPFTPIGANKKRLLDSSGKNLFYFQNRTLVLRRIIRYNSYKLPLAALSRQQFEAEDQTVDLMKILEDLRRERASIEEAILTLERLVEGRGRRRGRPPTWLAEARKRGRSTDDSEEPEIEEAVKRFSAKG